MKRQELTGGERTKVLKRALEYAREGRAAALAAMDAYNRDVDKWYTRGDGRPVEKGGRGYSYPYCVHGASLWSDYDTMCPGCESGYEYADIIYPLALSRARADYALYRARIDLYVTGLVALKLSGAATKAISDLLADEIDWGACRA